MQPGDDSAAMSFSELVFSDLARMRPHSPPSWFVVVTRLPFDPGLLGTLIVRAQQCLFRSGHVRMARGLQTLGMVLVSGEFGAGMIIGPGLALVHPVGVTMGIGARIGANVTLAGGVVMAARYYDGEIAAEAGQEFPVIEDGAVIGAHAVLVGGVRIGRNAVVGANSVVLQDVPENTVVFGVPARRISMRAQSATSSPADQVRSANVSGATEGA